MAKYRKKPVEVWAFCWVEGFNRDDYPQWVATLIRGGGITIQTCGDCGLHPVMKISTLEGVMQASPGDWIIQGVKGEIYPCKPDIFEATYDEVTDEPT